MSALPDRSWASIHRQVTNLRNREGNGTAFPWEDDEVDILVNARMARKSWSEICKILPGRSTQSLNNKWSHLAPRNARGEILAQDNRYWTTEDQRVLATCREKGMTIEEIREKFFPDKSYASVWQFTNRIVGENPPKPGEHHDFWSVEKIKTLRDLAGQDLTWKEIGQRLGCSATVAQMKWRKGVLRGAETPRPKQVEIAEARATLLRMLRRGAALEDVYTAFPRTSRKAMYNRVWGLCKKYDIPLPK